MTGDRKLVVGLGNPGPEYDRTRHNVGFGVLDRLARRFAPGAVARSRFQGAVIEVELEGRRTLLLKPATYMNRSGGAVGEAIRFYKLDPADDLLVIVDDTALACGVVRLRPEGGAGGHNGLGDIEQKLGTIGYSRLRIGVDTASSSDKKEYVLGRFRPDQLERIEPALEEAVAAVVCWRADGIIEAMNRFNRKQTV